MTFKPVSMNNVDAEVLGILKTTGTDIARIYKIPLPMVNDLEKSNYNTLEQLMIQFVVFALLPWVKRHEQSMMRDFLLPLTGVSTSSNSTSPACCAATRRVVMRLMLLGASGDGSASTTSAG